MYGRRGRPPRQELIECEDVWERLANAIIIQAVRDYKLGQDRQIGCKYNNENGEWFRNYESAKRFFFSDWFGVLTAIDPEYLISRLDQIVKLEKKMDKL
jgi:hypothetical protein